MGSRIRIRGGCFPFLAAILAAGVLAPRPGCAMGPVIMKPAGDHLFFTYYDGSTADYTHLWAADSSGTARLVKAFASIGSPLDCLAAGDRLVFAADDGITGLELWASDGTPEGTVQLADIVPGPVGSSPDMAYCGFSSGGWRSSSRRTPRTAGSCGRAAGRRTPRRSST